MGGWTVIAPGRPTPGTGQTIAIGAASVASAGFNTATQFIRISATGNCHVEIGPAPVATANSMLVKSTDDPERIRVGNGEKIAVIQDGASTGNLSVIEYTN